MKLLAINGSPRQTWNTATLLSKAVEGAASAGAETELIYLSDFNYKGCISCFACKVKGGKDYGRCGIKDGITPILDKVHDTDALLLGAPIYLGVVSSCMQAFFERLLYPYLAYSAERKSLFGKMIRTGFIYTLGATEERMKQAGYGYCVQLNQMLLQRIFGSSESLLAMDTYQFDDYSRYETSGIDLAQKNRVRKESFPESCKQAFELGSRLCREAH
jgi:multimeric flavodoxin WrbA